MGIRHRVQDRLLQALIVGVSLLITTMTTAKSNTHLSATQAAVLKHLNSNLDPSELNCTDTSAMRLNEGTAQGTGFGGGLKASVACANAQADAGQVVASELDYLEDDCYNNTGDEFINGPTEWEPGCICEILEDGTWYCTNKAFNDWLCCSSYIPPLSK